MRQNQICNLNPWKWLKKETYGVTTVKQLCLVIFKTASGSAIFRTTSVTQDTTRNIACRQI